MRWKNLILMLAAIPALCPLQSCDATKEEALLNDLIRYKTEQTVEFFAQVYGKAPNPDAIRLLMGSQFGYFRQLLDEHMEEERMLACLRALLYFFNAGWRQLCGTLD